jgi:hypothetical protein
MPKNQLVSANIEMVAGAAHIRIRKYSPARLSTPGLPEINKKLNHSTW